MAKKKTTRKLPGAKKKIVGKLPGEKKKPIKRVWIQVPKGFKITEKDKASLQKYFEPKIVDSLLLKKKVQEKTGRNLKSSMKSSMSAPSVARFAKNAGFAAIRPFADKLTSVDPIKATPISLTNPHRLSLPKALPQPIPIYGATLSKPRIPDKTPISAGV